MPDEMLDDKPTKPIKWVKSPNGVFEVYANMVHIVWSKDDMRIRLGQIIDSPQTPNPGPEFEAVSEERAAVTLSWREAVLLRKNLNQLIEAYEKINGEIKLEVKLPDVS